MRPAMGFTGLDCVIFTTILVLNISVYIYLLNSQPRIMHFAYSDWFSQSCLSAHIPKFGLIWKMIALTIAKLEMFSPESEIFIWIKPRKDFFFVESLDQCRRLEVGEKARNVSCDEPTSVSPQGVTQHCIFIKVFSTSLGFSRFFRSHFVLQIFGV